MHLQGGCFMKGSYVAVIFSVLIAFCFPAHAEQGPGEILKAIVKIRSVIPETARTARILGTEREGNGVLIDSNGHVLTIGYLILEAETTEIFGPDGKAIKATFVGYDDKAGFGLLRANKPLGVLPMKLGRSSDVKVGDPVLVASHGGNDFVQGVRVVSRQEFAGSWEYLLENAIFTSPPHPRFSGATLIGRDGKLLGIGSLFTQIMLKGVGSVPSNMFVPIDHLKAILSHLISTGRSQEPLRPWLGLNAEESYGRVLVIRVSPGGPAEKAGIQRGDIVLSVDKKSVKGLADFFRKVWALGSAGVDVPLRILQETSIRKIIVHSSDRYQYLQIQTR